MVPDRTLQLRRHRLPSSRGISLCAVSCVPVARAFRRHLPIMFIRPAPAGQPRVRSRWSRDRTTPRSPRRLTCRVPKHHRCSSQASRRNFWTNRPHDVEVSAVSRGESNAFLRQRQLSCHLKQKHGWVSAACPNGLYDTRAPAGRSITITRCLWQRFARMRGGGDTRFGVPAIRCDPPWGGRGVRRPADSTRRRRSRDIQRGADVVPRSESRGAAFRAFPGARSWRASRRIGLDFAFS